MIEFNGYITGKAEQFFFKKGRKIAVKIMLLAETCIFFPLILFAVRGAQWDLLILFGAMYVLLPLTFFIPKTKKEKRALLPKRIYTDGESITCVTEKGVESKFIGDEKEVIDHGEFYEIVYPIGKVSDKFVCQKDLLTQGSLEKFEGLFRNIKRNPK